MKRTIILFLLILACRDMKTVKIPENSIENLVISKSAQLFNSNRSDAQVIGSLQFLDTIYVLDNKLIDSKVKVLSIKGIEGWMNYNDISLLKEAKRIDSLNGLNLWVPADLPIVFKGKRIVKNSYSEKNIRYEFESQVYSIVLLITPNSNIKQIIEDSRESCEKQALDSYFNMPESPVIEEFILNNLNSLYISWYELHDRMKFYKINIPGENKDVCYIRVQMKKREFTLEEEVLAKKILFSTRVGRKKI
jgi:hypothetical protein